MPTAHGEDDVASLVDSDTRQPGPTALRLLLGAHLRRLREAHGVSRDEAAYLIRGSQSKISRMEAGRIGFKQRDVADLLTLYALTDEAERAALLALADQANEPAWWQDHRDVIPDWFEEYLGLEQDASLIRIHEVQYVPGLLQTEDYARAVIVQGPNAGSAAQIERRVAVRMRRQRIFDGPAPTRLWAVVDEASLRRRVGNNAIMRDQLEHLARMAELPHITIQILPFSAGGPSGGIGPVTLLRFAQVELPDVVYLEHLASAQYLTKPSEVGPYLHLMNTLGVQAASPNATRESLREMIAASLP
ncbi:helix-turn-helix domain-containing protein [Nonomuraea purpurea]|uniref:Helix-turn-helix domain-containing protein n=1 Tax=Nonomuraea purpurea TaxID=1849276 RepID=A0ABV8GSD6_9ACTN